MKYIYILLVFLLCSCSKSPQENLENLIQVQNQKYIDEAKLQIQRNFPSGTLEKYIFHSTLANFDVDAKGRTWGSVYVLFEKMGTKKRTQTGEKSFSETFDNIQVNFESFDSYRRIEFMITEEGKSSSKVSFIDETNL